MIPLSAKQIWLDSPFNADLYIAPTLYRRYVVRTVSPIVPELAYLLYSTDWKQTVEYQLTTNGTDKLMPAPRSEANIQLLHTV
jgi:hypothetical protein